MPVFVGTTNISSNGSSLNVSNGGTNWLTVDSTGRAVLPQIPYMRAILSGQGNFYRAATVTFGNVLSNVGNCWNNTTGLWTCPVNGLYLIGMGGIAAGAGNGTGFSYGYFDIKKNGSTVHFSHWNTQTYWDYCSMSAVVSCAANDTLSFMINPSYGYWYGAGDHGNFYITLLKG